MATTDHGEVKLLGSVWSPVVARVIVALHLKGIQYEFLDEKLPNKSELLLKSNPAYKKIPVLIHNSRPICESMNIVEYIDEVWSDSSNAILPEDPYDRAEHRFWAVYIDDKVVTGMKGLLVQTKEANAEVVEILLNVFELLEESFEKCSKGKAFFNGDNIGYLDIAFGGFFGWFKATEIITGTKLFDEIKFPHIVEWAERFCSHEALKDVFPETDKIAEFIVRVAKAYAQAQGH